eukprot:CAMPEP_0174824852 /NCGR_PEP_ID=MMETSP1107-20130205/38770_1 /TAXON_ID=36770 /ORGANISM="Paraphysomonas vestita, Strain GFlagA" /LENGTH=72 /DNA_ID=CAMNT_0016054389 /DNA_START=214 /DNA_END=432 /DNA_ORIENTATION=-
MGLSKAKITAASCFGNDPNIPPGIHNKNLNFEFSEDRTSLVCNNFCSRARDSDFIQIRVTTSDNSEELTLGE